MAILNITTSDRFFLCVNCNIKWTHTMDGSYERDHALENNHKIILTSCPKYDLVSTTWPS